MTPRFHEEFVALCALFYSGEISDEEWALLQVHLAYCDSCRHTFEQYEEVHQGVIPAMAAAAASQSASAPYETASTFADAESRLMNRVGNTPPAAQPKLVSQKPFSQVWGAVLAACFVVVVAVFAYFRSAPSGAPSQQVSVSRPPAMAPFVPAPPTSSNSDGTALQESQNEIARLRQQIAILEKQPPSSDSAAATLQQQLQVELEQRDKLASDRDALSTQLATAQADIHALHNRVISAESRAEEQTAQVTALETKVHSLNATLEDTNGALADRERMLALDKDFLAHDRDIRNLIGARDLYIADIFDTTETGRTAKPFGRIFYTQDRSLVFYGFDLDKQAGIKKSVVFQAWGSSPDKQTVNLGLFYQDDSNKRWVLRCNDSKALSRLNMVFVTVEPPGGSNSPTGKQLLRAYLQIQPNHP